MPVSHHTSDLTFGEYRIEVRTRRLYLDGRAIAVTSKAFDVLVELVSRGGEVVSKDELMAAAWSDTAVEENNLTQQISLLRKLLGEQPGENRFIVTVPGRGYCFVVPVRALEIEAESDLVVRGSTRSSITIDLSAFIGHRLFRNFRFDRNALFGAGLAAAYALAVCLTVLIFDGRDPARSASAKRSVGILTFKSLGAGDDRLGVGIRDTLRAKLGSLEDITVYPDLQEGPVRDALDAGRQMNVDVVLAGSIQEEQGRIRVAVEMVDVRSRRIVWGRTFDETVSNTFELQDSIATAVAERLNMPRLNSRNKNASGGIDATWDETALAAMAGPLFCRRECLVAA